MYTNNYTSTNWDSIIINKRQIKEIKNKETKIIVGHPINLNKNSNLELNEYHKTHIVKDIKRITDDVHNLIIMYYIMSGDHSHKIIKLISRPGESENWKFYINKKETYITKVWFTIILKRFWWFILNTMGTPFSIIQHT